MLRALAIFLVLVTSSAHGAECTAAVEGRWNAATREDARRAQIVATEAKKGSKASKAAICKVVRSVPNLLRAAREYYGACDPERAQAAIAPIQAHAEEAEAFYQANCLALPGAEPAAR